MAYQQPDRYQGVLFPPTVDEFVPEDAPVRAYDAIVEAMDLAHMGIEINHHKVGLSAHPLPSKGILDSLMP